MLPEGTMGNIDNRKDVLLLLLFAPGPTGDEGEPIDGRTRLMKFLYLLHRQLAIEDKLGIKKPYSFEPYHYGPFSKDLYEDLEFLSNVGLITSMPKGLAAPFDQKEEERVVEDTSIGDSDDDLSLLFQEERFRLTGKGIDFVRSTLLPDVPEPIMKAIRQIKTDLSPLSLTTLLRYVYAKYPDSAENSKLQYLAS
jgi:hypothetical protein